MNHGLVDNLHQLFTTVGNRRVALAALVSGAASGVAPAAAGVSLARNGKKNRKKHNRKKSKNKTNQPGSGDPSLPNLRYVQQVNVATPQSEASLLVECACHQANNGH